MVVLEEGGMLTTGHNQYLQPDYLSPLPTTVSSVIGSSLLNFRNFEEKNITIFSLYKYYER